jgi:hypothetical protein
VGRSHSGGPINAGLRLLVAAGLAVDAYVHFDLASAYDAIGGSITQGMLFRAEAVAAVVVALLVLVVGRLPVYLAAFAVAAGGLAAVLLYRWVDVGPLGPLPNMYEPVWYSEKTFSAVAQAIAALAAAVLAARAVRASHARRPLHRDDHRSRPPR